MRKYKNQDIIRHNLVETSITCNRCGLEYDLEKQSLEVWQADTIQRLKINFGYGTIHDGETWEFDLCSNCVEEICNSFSIPVKKEKYF